jgi:hypothetical protein
MTKSCEMLTLLSMLNEDSVPGRITIRDLADQLRRIARKSATLRADVGGILEDGSSLRSLVRKHAIEPWCDAVNPSGTPYFSFDGKELRSAIEIPVQCRSEFQDLLREVVDWRLAEYLDREKPRGASQFLCKVIHTNGRPILKLPDRAGSPEIPQGWIRLSSNGRNYVGKFVSRFLNVVRTDRDSEENALPEILREWFGADAGRPGTRFQVSFEPDGDGLRMEPIDLARGVSSKAQLWNHYMRENIPSLFSFEFSQGRWNQGFVVAERRIFLLVTLEKSGLNKDHRYDDSFLSAHRFLWQSQNRTRQDSKHGRMILDHKEEAVDVHLFVRKHKLFDKKAAPFVYCGQVDLESWEGDAPITVVWRLREPVPDRLWKMFDVPDRDEAVPGKSAPAP